jgi:predicted kinase
MKFKSHYFVEQSLPEFIMLIGIPGSGKSTWISNFNKNNKYIVVSPDLIRKEITGNISDQSQNSKVWFETKKRVIDYLKNGKNVILDATMTSSVNRRDFIKDLPQSKLKAKVFYVDPNISKERIKNDIDYGKDRANVPPEVIDKMYDDLMKKVKLLDGGILDVSKLEDEGFEIIQ